MLIMQFTPQLDGDPQLFLVKGRTFPLRGKTSEFHMLL